MLPDFANYDNVWVEITGADEDHGGTGWEFGTCLWSPTTEEGGGKRYETMWRPQPGDLVLHFYKYPWNNSATYTQLCGYSVVSEPCRIVHTPPPVPEKWLAPAYYRIGLESYAALPKRLNPQSLNVQPEYLARIRAELIPNRPPRYPFATYGPLVRLTQGQYLTQCTPVLYDVLRDALGFNGAPSVAVKTKKPRTEEYKEGERKLRETYFFTRNPTLAAEAKRLRGYLCEVCGFDFQRQYGEHGKEFAECHHKNPLSERPEEMWTQAVSTSLEDVAVMCSNCHRMLHRTRPAMSVEKLKAIWTAAAAVNK